MNPSFAIAIQHIAIQRDNLQLHLDLAVTPAPPPVATSTPSSTSAPEYDYIACPALQPAPVSAHAPDSDSAPTLLPLAHTKNP